MKTPVSCYILTLIPLLSVGIGECSCEKFANVIYWRVVGQVSDGEAGLGTRLVVVGDSGTVVTAEGVPPYTWIDRTSGVTANLNDAQFSPVESSQLVLAVGDDGTIIRSTNAGADWTTTGSGTIADLKGVSFAPGEEARVFAVGDDGAILISTDAGLSWESRSSGTINNLRAVYAISADVILAAGRGGAILRTSDGGANWVVVYAGPTFLTFNRFEFDIRPGIGGVMWVVGDGGAVFSSITDGSSWDQQNSFTVENLNDIHFRDGLIGVIVGDNGIVRHTLDGGDSWLVDTYLNTRTTEDILSVYPMVDVDTLFGEADYRLDTVVTGVVIAGGLNTVSTVPLTHVSPPVPVIPVAFALHQNYPNPFNAETIIGVDLPQASHVQLEVFTTLGELVALLKDEELPGGYQRIRFEGGGLSSGMYLYRLRAGNFVSTRKLVLLH
jgi:hypothetical protein